jgi:hypothetical protein
MLRAGLRRLASLVGASLGVVLLVAAALALLLGTGLARSVSLGFYLVGTFLLVGGFFFGNRGPVRLRGRPGEEGFFGVSGRRRIGWATPEEQEDALATSAVYVGLGVLLVLVGVVVDDRFTLV